MDRSTGRNPFESVSTDEVSEPDVIDGRIPTIDFFPADIVRHRTARWRGLRAKTMQIINHDPVEYRFKQQYHLLIAIEQGVCHEAETFIKGLPISIARNCSHRLIFVPAGRMFFGAATENRPVHQNIIFMDNHVSEVPGPAFYISSANNVVLYRNTLQNTNSHTLENKWNSAGDLNFPIVVNDASNILLRANTIGDAASGQDAVGFDPVTTTGITVLDR